MKVYIRGASTTKFGELWGTSPRELSRSAVSGALVSAGIQARGVDALFVGNMLSGMLGGQEHLGAFFAEELGFASIPAYKVEGACASGSLAVHTAFLSLLSGQYTTAVVLGVEKMTDFKPEEVSTALMGAGSDEERVAGSTFPGLYATLARAHMATYGTTSEQMAAVSVKNHLHASMNPDAQFHSILTVEKVLKSALVADPLRLLDCSPISDGASALVLSVKPPPATSACVNICASRVATDTLGLAARGSLTEIAATGIAAKRAFDDCGMNQEDIDLVEVHDCFSIAEILALEDLGFHKKGEAGAAIASGAHTIGSTHGPVVNTSGGLKGCGHPVGATGVKQISELYLQLVGKAGKRQVKGAAVGLAQNVGGSGSTAVVHIVRRER